MTERTIGEPLAEARNVIYLARNLTKGALVWDSFPFKVEISDNNLCNLKCKMCSPVERPSAQRLSPDQLKRIASQVFPTASIIIPSSNSEPFLAQMDLLFEACEQYDLYMDIYTNATLLTRERLEKVAPRLYKLQISFDSHIKEVYEKIRLGARYEEVLSNIRQAITLSAPLGLHPIAVSVFMTENMDHLHDYLAFLKKTGFRFAQIQQLLYVAPGLEELDPFVSCSMEKIREILERIKIAAREHSINLALNLPHGLSENLTFNPVAPRITKALILDNFYRVVGESFPSFCPHVAFFLKINPDGNVYPCCRAPAELCMGNILETDFPDIWNGEKYQTLRSNFFQGRVHDCCRGCALIAPGSSHLTS